MEWRDEGLITGLKKYGETSVILETMTKAHGRHLGLVKGGRSKRMHAMLQPGNQIDMVWRARLDEHLGTFAIEATTLRAARVLVNAEALHALNLITSLLRLMPERDPHPNLYRAASLIANELDASDHVAAMLVRFEMIILAELGFGLDLDRCAATGGHDDLIYVSPKSGRAVSRAAGAPYHDKLLALPTFLRGDDHDSQSPSCQVPSCDIRAGFKLTEYFLMRDLFAPRGLPMPLAHHAYLAELSKSY